jgi:hypothetical protein
MALGSTQPLVKMSTSNIPGCKCGRCVRVTTSPPLSVPTVMKSGSLNLLEPSGPHRACYGTPLPFTECGMKRPLHNSQCYPSICHGGHTGVGMTNWSIYEQRVRESENAIRPGARVA